MRLAIILSIAGKEILSTLRDRRAIVSSLLIPLLVLPLVMLGLPLLIGGLFEREQTTLTEVAVQGLGNLPGDLRSEIEAQSIVLTPVDDPEAAVREDRYAVSLGVPEGFESSLREGRGELTVYSKTGNLRSELSAGKLEDAIGTYQQELVAERLRSAGLEPSVLVPISIDNQDARQRSERSSGQLAWLIPFFIAVWTLAGGQMTAIDATAGEKERGTLESLLVAPVRRAEVVVGKFLATMTFGLSAALMAILGYVLGGTVLRQVFKLQGEEAQDIVSVMGGALDVSAFGVVMLIVSALLLAGLIAALLISIAMFARSFKEAQSYVAPLSFVLILPAVGLQFADFFGSNPVLYLIPVLNTLIVMNDLVKGSAEALPLLLTYGSTLAYTALLLDFAFRSFKREGVIFRT